MLHIKTITFSAAIVASTAMADQLTVSINNLGDPTAFSITSGSNLSLRVVEQLPGSNPNSSTHILIEGLSPIEQGSSVYASSYRGINSADGSEQDLGILYLEMPAGAALPEGTVSSPIVGVVQRSGAWADYSIFSPETSIGGAAGSSEIATGGDYIEAQLTRGNESFSGNIPYTVVDENTLELGDFTMVKDGATSIDLSGTILYRDGLRFYGTVSNLSEGAAYDALLFEIELTDIPDIDLDGIPDITDPDVSAGGLTVGEWQQIEIGWVFGDTPEWGTSTFMGPVWMPYYPYVYHINLGWIYHLSANAGTHIFYDWDIGWIIANESNGGWYYYFASNQADAVWAEFKNPQP